MWRSRSLLRRGGLPRHVASLLEEWAGVLLALGIALLLLATLKAQVARAADLATGVDAAQRPSRVHVRS